MDSCQHPKWAELSHEFLSEISKKLFSVYDYLHFSLVCKSWLAFALQNKLIQHRITSKFPQKPMLVVPSEDGIKGNHSLYDFATKKIYDIDLKVDCNERWCGSSHGWLFMIEETPGFITLLNPFSRMVIHLPLINVDYPRHIYKAILTKDPLLYPYDYMVVAIYGTRDLAIIRANDNTWTLVNPNNHYCFLDVIVHDEIIYVLEDQFSLWKVDERSGDGNSTFQLNLVAPDLESPYVSDYTLYIVESSKGEILLVQRFFKHEIPHEMYYGTRDFKVYKLTNMCEDGLRRHVEVKSLDDGAIFVGNNHSMCVSTKDFTQCLPNHIYYTHHDYFGPQDTGIFNLEDQSFDTHYVTNPAHDGNRSSPIWIFPTLL